MTPEEREKAVHTLTKFCMNHVCHECLFNNDNDCLMPDTETAIDRVLQAAVDRIRERRPVTADQSAQPEQTDCEYCHEDSDGYVRPIEKNSHAWLVRRGRTMKLRIGFKGEYRECNILFCPMCGRKLTDE